jgi:hypothetical protein
MHFFLLECTADCPNQLSNVHNSLQQWFLMVGALQTTSSLHAGYKTLGVVAQGNFCFGHAL